MPTVVILEDDQVTCELLAAKVQQCQGFSTLATAMSLAEAEQVLSVHNPDVLLVDLELPDGNSFDLIRQQTDLYPTRPILVISIFGDETRVIKAISAGARGYLLKDEDGIQIEKALNAALDGQSPISPSIAAHLVRHFQERKENAVIDNPLSERELEVLHLAAKGFSYKEVAELIGVGVSTVGTYTMRVYTKLAVNSRAEALFEARRLGIMD